MIKDVAKVGILSLRWKLAISMLFQQNTLFLRYLTPLSFLYLSLEDSIIFNIDGIALSLMAKHFFSFAFGHLFWSLALIPLFLIFGFLVL